MWNKLMHIIHFYRTHISFLQTFSKESIWLVLKNHKNCKITHSPSSASPKVFPKHVQLYLRYFWYAGVKTSLEPLFTLLRWVWILILLPKTPEHPPWRFGNTHPLALACQSLHYEQFEEQQAWERPLRTSCSRGFHFNSKLLFILFQLPTYSLYSGLIRNTISTLLMRQFCETMTQILLRSKLLYLPKPWLGIWGHLVDLSWFSLKQANFSVIQHFTIF